jgi:hypothetical protein
VSHAPNRCVDFGRQVGREAAFEVIRAGMPFREVEKIAREAMIKAGMPKNVPAISLHSVGLQHGDDPQRDRLPFKVRDDHVLAENMTITLDLPYLEVGEGAGHDEDLLRITRNGYELLNDPLGSADRRLTDRRPPLGRAPAADSFAGHNSGLETVAHVASFVVRKLWQSHLVQQLEGGAALLAIDRIFLHERTVLGGRGGRDR